MTVYGDVHRRFLQSFVYHPVQTEKELNEIYHLACNEQEQDMSESLDHVIETVNITIKKHTTLEIKSVICELTGEKYYVAINNTNLSWSKITSRYNSNEQILFKKIVEGIMMSEEGYVSSTACLNASGRANMTKSDASSCITKFVADGWFVEKRGCLYMGVRGAAELEPYIVQVHSEIINQCPLCKKLVFWGDKCEFCPEKTHHHCILKYIASTGGRATCPACNKDWLHWDPENNDFDESD